MRNWNYKKEDGKEVWKELEKVINYQSRDRIFEDWLDLILNALLALTDNFKRENFIEKLKQNKLDGKFSDKYLEIVEKYDKEKIKHFANAFYLLKKETEEKQKDILGDIYMEMITFGQSGQFFTPNHICELMTKMAGIKEEKINDPCCGSGRFLISAFKENPNAQLFGTDIDNRCAKMAVINMNMFDCNSIITWGDGLAFSENQKWATMKGGYVYELQNT